MEESTIKKCMKLFSLIDEIKNMDLLQDDTFDRVQASCNKKQTSDKEAEVDYYEPPKRSKDNVTYIISEGDFIRNNSKERLYRKLYMARLLEIFGNRCAACGQQDNGIDLDHYFFAASHGGNFFMKRSDGYLVNNAIPLCWTCNRSKLAKKFSDVIAPKDRERITNKVMIMTRLINLDEETRKKIFNM